MKRWIACISLAVAALGVVMAPSAARAGGWALASFDEVPALTAGSDVEIGFTILQHGVTPVDESVLGEPAGLIVTDSNGTQTVFPAVESGPTGHYVATITVPAAGAATISADMGWFEPSAPMTVDVQAPSDPGGGWPTWIGIVLPMLGLACLLIVLLDVLAGRRTRVAARVARADIDVVADPSAL
jgi:hypothetical protein